MAINNISVVTTSFKLSEENCIKWDTLFDEDEKEWIATKPSLGSYVYPCYSCRCLFYSKKSFLDHINRRAILLTFFCSECKKKSKYYNRCALLLHCRKHFTAERGIINLTKLKIAPLDISLVGFSKMPYLPYYFDVPEENYAVGGVEINSKFYVPQSIEKGRDVITLLPKHLLFTWLDPFGSIQLLSLKPIAVNIPKCEFIGNRHSPLYNKEGLKKVVQAEVSDVDEIIINSSNTNLNTNTSEPSDNQSGLAKPLSGFQLDKTNTSNIRSSNNYTLPVVTKIETVEEECSGNNLDTLISSTDMGYVVKIKCPECNSLLTDSLKNHFLGSNIPIYNTLKCNICKLLCTSECSLKAHERLHTYQKPYICPDCGEQFQHLAKFHHHLNNVCYHSLKLVKYKCPGRRCGKIFASAETFGPHFSTCHVASTFQCCICKKSYKTLNDCATHCLSHPKGANILKKFSCLTCSLTDMQTAEIEQHVNDHCTYLSKCIYIFACSSCKNYFRALSSMSSHAIHCKGVKANKYKIANSRSKYLLSKYITGSCEKCKNRIIFTRSKPATMCNKCLPVPRDATVKNEQTTETCFCLLCNSHIKKNSRYQHKLNCKYAKPQIVLENLDINNINKYQERSNSTTVKSSPNTSLESETPPKKRSKFIKPKKTEVIRDLIADGPIEFNGTYRCRLCDYLDIHRDNFHIHIKGHRQISTAYQCMECGECFVVKPSLIKHLMHYHNIQDCEQYFKENDCYDVGAVTELSNVVKAPYLANKVKEHQCKVCLIEFTNQDEHDKHFRSHGMAFLMKNSG